MASALTAQAIHQRAERLAQMQSAPNPMPSLLREVAGQTTAEPVPRAWSPERLMLLIGLAALVSAWVVLRAWVRLEPGPTNSIALPVVVSLDPWSPISEELAVSVGRQALNNWRRGPGMWVPVERPMPHPPNVGMPHDPAERFLERPFPDDPNYAEIRFRSGDEVRRLVLHRTGNRLTCTVRDPEPSGPR